MLSLVSALLPPGSDPRSYTPREQANIDTVLKLRSAPFGERRNYMHRAMVRHRWGFASLADVTGMKDGVGYDASTCSDRVDTIEDLIAKDDRVWAVWTMRGTHTGQLFGIPATGQPIEILEAGIWRLVDGLVIEAWFFGDELRLLRQLGVIPDAQLRAAASLARPDRLGSGASPVMVDLWEHPVAPKDPASGKCRLIPLAVGLRCGPWDFSTEHHELGKELLAGFATAELDKHLEKGYYDHLDREQLQYQAQQQANYLYDQQYGQY